MEYTVNFVFEPADLITVLIRKLHYKNARMVDLTFPKGFNLSNNMFGLNSILKI